MVQRNTPPCHTHLLTTFVAPTSISGRAIRIFRSRPKNLEDMLEFCKKILTKVSFDRLLFKKELKKAISRLSKEDIPALKNWCVQQFGTIYGDIIQESFPHAIA